MPKLKKLLNNSSKAKIGAKKHVGLKTGSQFKVLSGLVVCVLSGGPTGSTAALHQLLSCSRPWLKVASSVITSNRWGEKEEVQPGDRERKKTHKHIQCIESGECSTLFYSICLQDTHQKIKLITDADARLAISEIKVLSSSLCSTLHLVFPLDANTLNLCISAQHAHFIKKK